MRIAVLMLAVGDLTGSGGAERYFADLHDRLAADPGNDIWFVTSRQAFTRLHETGRLRRAPSVISLRLGRAPGRTRASVAWITFRLLWLALSRRFDVVHISLPTPTYVPFAAVLTRLPRPLRPRVTLSVIDCTVAPSFDSRPPRDVYERQVCEAHSYYFRWTVLDGIYTWYEAFAKVARRRRLVPAATIVTPARFCFTDPARFCPAASKEKLIVFAGRLSEQKRPVLFVDAVDAVRRIRPDLMTGWRVEMYGAGPLLDTVQRRIVDLALGGLVTITHTPDLAPVFGRSRVFVSTQADENFTSLAMLEAMAAGNAIIAADVGQTREFVRSGSNGILVAEETADGFAAALIEYLEQPELNRAMETASRRIASEVHTIEHSAADIMAFWREVAGNTAA